MADPLSWLILAGITLAAALLRVPPWLANYPLHRDEALYGYWTRLIASGQDPLLLIPWVDKPPLSIYLAAGSIAALGTSELALRVPGMVASILIVPTTYALARQAYGETVARLAAGLLALSPFAILFAPTAFTDPWLALWLVVAAWAALAQRSFLAGLAAGLAVASKQQGALVVPLVIMLSMIHPIAGRRSSLRHSIGLVIQRLARALLGFALIFGPLTYWDSLRWHNRPSFWDRSLTTYGPLTLAAPGEWPARVAAWARQLGYLFGAPALSWLALGTALAVGLIAIWRVTRRRQLDRQRWLDLILATYVSGFLVLHIIVTFQPWDRYLLPLAPLVCVLVARGVWLAKGAGFRNHVSRRNMVPKAGALVLAIALGYAAWLGAAGRIPVGSDRSAYAGVQEVATILRSQPATAVIYHHSLGWYFDFYLFDAPQERRWYDTGGKLARDAAHTAESEPDQPQWLIATQWEATEVGALKPTLAARNLALVETAEVSRPDGSCSFVMYRIMPLAAGGGQ